MNTSGDNNGAMKQPAVGWHNNNSNNKKRETNNNARINAYRQMSAALDKMKEVIGCIVANATQLKTTSLSDSKKRTLKEFETSGTILGQLIDTVVGFQKMLAPMPCMDYAISRLCTDKGNHQRIVRESQGIADEERTVETVLRDVVTNMRTEGMADPKPVRQNKKKVHPSIFCHRRDAPIQLRKRYQVWQE